MEKIQPLDYRHQQTVIQRTQEYLDKATGIFGRNFDPIAVVFDLKGKSAGMYRCSGQNREIRYNPWVFSKYLNDNLANTVPHEVAHYVINMIYGTQVRPHGSEWKKLMLQFGATPSRTCNYNLEGIAVRKYQCYLYQCSCRDYQFTSRRHYQVQRGNRQYMCRTCNSYVTLKNHTIP